MSGRLRPLPGQSLLKRRHCDREETPFAPAWKEEIPTTEKPAASKCGNNKDDWLAWLFANDNRKGDFSKPFASFHRCHWILSPQPRSLHAGIPMDHALTTAAVPSLVNTVNRSSFWRQRTKRTNRTTTGATESKILPPL